MKLRSAFLSILVFTFPWISGLAFGISSYTLAERFDLVTSEWPHYQNSFFFVTRHFLLDDSGKKLSGFVPHDNGDTSTYNVWDISGDFPQKEKTYAFPCFFPKMVGKDKLLCASDAQSYRVQLSLRDLTTGQILQTTTVEIPYIETGGYPPYYVYWMNDNKFLVVYGQFLYQGNLVDGETQSHDLGFVIGMSDGDDRDGDFPSLGGGSGHPGIIAVNDGVFAYLMRYADQKKKYVETQILTLDLNTPGSKPITKTIYPGSSRRYALTVDPRGGFIAAAGDQFIRISAKGEMSSMGWLGGKDKFDFHTGMAIQVSKDLKFLIYYTTNYLRLLNLQTGDVEWENSYYARDALYQKFPLYPGEICGGGCYNSANPSILTTDDLSTIVVIGDSWGYQGDSSAEVKVFRR